MYLCGPGKHSCQPFCGPEDCFYCSDSVCSLWPAPFSYLCVAWGFCVCWKLSACVPCGPHRSLINVWAWGFCVCWKLSAAEQVKPDCCLLWSPLYWLRCLCPVLWPLNTITQILLVLYTTHIEWGAKDRQGNGEVWHCLDAGVRCQRQTG